MYVNVNTIGFLPNIKKWHSKKFVSNLEDYSLNCLLLFMSTIMVGFNRDFFFISITGTYTKFAGINF